MIEQMLKLTMVARLSDKATLLKELGRVGVVHLIPLETQVTEETKFLDSQVERINRVLNIISKIEESDQIVPNTNPVEEGKVNELVDKILTINEKIANLEKENLSISKQIENQELWGKISQQDILGLAKSGLRVRFFKGDKKAISALNAQLVYNCGKINSKFDFVATVGVVTPLPQGITEITPPLQNCPSLYEDYEQKQEEIKALSAQLLELAGNKNSIKKEFEKLTTNLYFQKALDGTYNNSDFFALSGWLPKKKQEEVAKLLGKETCYHFFSEPDDEDTPPTLITYPKWAQAIAGLFDVLKVIPGYRESEISAFFMIFLPIFVAMIIGDAGYGLSMLALGIIFRKKIVALAGKDKANLLIILSLATSIYGMLFGSYFGNSPSDIAKLIGFASLEEMLQSSAPIAYIGKGIFKLAPLWSPDSNDFKTALTVLSFVLGCCHLVLAHIVQFFKYLPSQQALAELGWAIFISGMFGVIWILFLQKDIPFIVGTNVIVGELVVGALLSICFSCPTRKWFKSRIPCGFASCILSWISAFSDMVSYVRLMAVGLSGYYIATTVNSLAQQASDALSDYSVLAFLAFALVFVIGHLFNVVLALIAVLAHGVRLNMLEFSNNAGVQWSGVNYSPFALLRTKGE